MVTRLLNVRLDEERLRKVRSLRERGVSLSDLVRAAIDERYEQTHAPLAARDVRAIFARLDAEHPLTEVTLPPRGYDVHDRRQAAAAIASHMRDRKRRAR